MPDEILREAQRLYRLGFAIHWLHPKSKRPIGAGWTEGPRKSWEELERSYRKGMNVGVRLGKASRLSGKYLAVIDVDVKSEEKRHETEALAAARRLLNGHRCPVVRSGRGNGSRHYYVVTDEPFQGFDTSGSPEEVRVLMPSVAPSGKERKLLGAEELARGLRLRRAWEVSLMSEGRQVVLPPSIHPDSGRPYRFSRGITDITDIPVLKELPAKPVSKEKTVRDGEAVGILEDFEVSPVDLVWLPISEEIRAAIVEGKGVTDRSAYLVKAASALFSVGLSRNEILTVLTDPDTYLGKCGYDHAQSSSRRAAARWVHRYTVGKIERERSPVGIFASAPLPARKLTAEEQAVQAAEFGEERNWRQDLDRTREGKTRVTLKNLDLILTNMVGPDVFVEDLFAFRIEYGRETPWGGKAGHHVEDIDELLVKRWLADTEFGVEPGRQIVKEVTDLIAHRRGVHPVREWLDSLRWDGISRVDTWIRNLCEGQAPEPYLSQVSRKFLVAMVKRVFEPGCQWDYTLILEGEQGAFKSSIARAIASDRWFMDNLPDLRDKDSMLNLQGKWLIELGELADVKRADYSQVKAYLVRREDTVRRHYGRIAARVPRQSVFIGTINEGQYLKDPTGNRRYWPVRVGTCDVAGFTAVRDQLFAEAVRIYRSGEEILTLDKAATIQAKEAQEERRVDDDESAMLESFLSYRESEEGKRFNFSHFRLRDLMIGVNVPWGAWAGKGYALNVAAHVLLRLGYRKKGKRAGLRFWGITPKKVMPSDALRCPETDKTDFF